jgi:hypothetical protein
MQNLLTKNPATVTAFPISVQLPVPHNRSPHPRLHGDSRTAIRHDGWREEGDSIAEVRACVADRRRSRCKYCGQQAISLSLTPSVSLTAGYTVQTLQYRYRYRSQQEAKSFSTQFKLFSTDLFRHLEWQLIQIKVYGIRPYARH